jgi:adenylate cyclase
LGDVISEEGDIYGDVVNVAARLQEVAQPGGICLSATAFEHIGGRVNIAVDDRGEQRLKNIVKPVHVYAVRGDQSEGVTHARTSESLSLADKPSIAVLPFQNMSGDPEQGYFADGVTEDIITELSRFRDLLVIARNSSFQYRGKDIDIRRVGRELDVGYVIEGSIRRAGDRIRITAQLIDAGTGKHLWAERYDREALDLFTLQEEMARSIAATVGGRIEAAGVDRATRADPATLKAYDLILRAKALAFKYTKQANAEAREFARQAMEIHPPAPRRNPMSDTPTSWTMSRAGLRMPRNRWT